ncbi:MULTISPECIES: hypothetical protein [Vibrio]|uniref:hypothetical protein n=1 Tax=Vibrio TaxID=662 RepID=UPI0004E2C0E9|nr:MULTISPECIES: hypothetical protein [Vibrio]EJL6304703.1 hypothetical protein [Vibrio cholerae]KFE10812.1 hypothetical protein DN36_197 [Vibrio cholerae]GHX75431.1 hypothetical protein VCSRO110_0671 [Vibrio cholerae]GHZ87350.1 hypothetical protein VCSRO35_0199 [Vibrio cholerae]GIA98472.1 hypothetical protein VCSRO184_0232 [Vibrio cholerae]
MEKFLAVLKSRKVISALVTLLSALALSFGYNVSPEFKSAVSVITCEIVECVE